MYIYIPYISKDRGADLLWRTGYWIGVRADVEPTGKRPRLRKAAVTPIFDVTGIPHFEYKVRLFPDGDIFRKWSLSRSTARRVNAVCWHGHKRFMEIGFLQVCELMTIKTAIAKYYGQADFRIKYPDTNDQMFNIRSTCACAYTQ